MQDHASYQTTDRTPTHATIRIDIPSTEARTVLDAVYAEYSRELHIPGFRRGKVPRNVLNTRFGEETFLVESRQRMRETHLPAALAELDLHPVTRPEIVEQEASPSGDFSFEASFSILPEVEIPDLTKIEAERSDAAPVTDEDVSAALDEVQQRFATLSPKQDPIVAAGDVVQVADTAGETWSFRTSDADPMLADVIGKSVGDTFSLSVPDTSDAETPSQPVEFTVSEVRSVILPEIDDELAKDAGHESLSEMRNVFREQMSAVRADAAKARTHTNLLDATMAKIDLELPPPFVDELVAEEREQLIERLQASRPGAAVADILSEQGETESSLREKIEASVTERVRRELVVHALIDHFHVNITDEDLTAAAERDAERRGENPMRYVARLKAEDHWESYRSSLAQDQALDRLAELATLREKTTPNGVSAPQDTPEADEVADATVVDDGTSSGGTDR
ncbi:trigger factor [Candidatus Bipolaricaulota bacterium]|nr:trigger factor [Candidatus Bipolaricaulota bacterium]